MTRVELWNMLVDYSIKNKAFPKSDVFAEYSRIPEATIKKVYKMWMSEGKLNKLGDTFIFTDNTIQSKLMENKIEYNKQIIRAPVRKKAISHNNLILKSIRIIAVIIGSILTIVSIHFTFNHNKLGMNPFWGLLLSASIVCFMSFAFTIRSYVITKSTRFLIVILWVLGISYSVFTAVSGQFGDFRKYDASDNSVNIERQNKIYEKQLKAAEKKQEELLHWRKKEEEYTENPDLKVENPGTWKQIQNGTKELKEIESEIMEIQNKILVNINNDVVLDETIYNWLASFLGIGSDVIQFIFILFPALFIDLCSTVCFTFALGKENVL